MHLCFFERVCNINNVVLEDYLSTIPIHSVSVEFLHGTTTIVCAFISSVNILLKSTVLFYSIRQLLSPI